MRYLILFVNLKMRVSQKSRDEYTLPNRINSILVIGLASLMLHVDAAERSVARNDQSWP